MENDIKTILEKLTGLDTKVSGLETQVSGLNTNVSGLQTQLNTFEQKVERNFADTSESIAGVMAMATERLDRIEKNHLRRLEHVELATVDLRHNVTNIKAHVGIE